MSGIGALARALFQWNTPDDPYFVIKGRSGEVDERDPYIPIVEAILADPGPLLAALAEAGVLTVDLRPGVMWVPTEGDEYCQKPEYRYSTGWRSQP